MLNPFEERHIDASIDKALTEMDYYEVSSDEFTTAVNNVAALARAKQQMDSNRVSGDAIVGAAASFAGIFTVLHFEKLGVVTSKAFSIATRLIR